MNVIFISVWSVDTERENAVRPQLKLTVRLKNENPNLYNKLLLWTSGSKQQYNINVNTDDVIIL